MTLRKTRRSQTSMRTAACKSSQTSQCCLFADAECSFCHESEENDPSPEYEEYLACSVCGDNGRCMKLQACNFPY